MSSDNQISTSFPATRMRRLRQHDWSRRLVQETTLTVNDLIWPLFVIDGEGRRETINSMPGIERLTIDHVREACETASQLGIPVIGLFPYTDPDLRSEDGIEATNPENLICRTVREIKSAFPNLGVMCDVALDPYTTHGHDGLVNASGAILNDETVEVLIAQSLCLAHAGCDIIAPSDMMDGRVGAIRNALEANQSHNTMIMSYAVKYASSFYGPFRDAVGSGSRLAGDKKTYQMNLANSDEAIREVALDLAEGADMILVKPGLPYLDIAARIKQTYGVPTFSYQVSGEYAMIKAAAQNQWIEEDAAILESLASFKRAGCDGIITYFAPIAAKLLTP